MGFSKEFYGLTKPFCKKIGLVTALTLSSNSIYAANTIKVGVLHSLSGTMAISEVALKNTALMAIDEINAKGGLLGKKLEPVVVDPGSDWNKFADKTKQLLTKNKVDVIFGCWTSASRKKVLPVVEKYNGLLFYPVQYEGQEQSANIYYTGAAPNQQAIPAVKYLMEKQGVKRFVLLGTDYVYPRTTNKILKTYLRANKIHEHNIAVRYTKFGHQDYSRIIKDIKRFSKGKKTAIISTINGDSNQYFYKELAKQNIKATDIPVMAFSVGEEELRGSNTKNLVGHMAAWNYFMSLKTPENRRFISKYRAWAKKNNISNHNRLVTNDPMEATYMGVNMWADAVKKAKSTNITAVKRQLNKGVSMKSPSGYTISMDKKNHHLRKPVMIGKVRADGQFDVVFKTKNVIKAQPWSPYIFFQNGAPKN